MDESPELARSRLQVQELRRSGQQVSMCFDEEGKARRTRATHLASPLMNSGLPKTMLSGNTSSAGTDICLLLPWLL